MIAHKHENWTGKMCPACNGGGERSAPECSGGKTCKQPDRCCCPFSCPDCGGTGDEYGAVPAEKCGDTACPDRTKP